MNWPFRRRYYRLEPHSPEYIEANQWRWDRDARRWEWQARLNTRLPSDVRRSQS